MLIVVAPTHSCESEAIYLSSRAAVCLPGSVCIVVALLKENE